MGLGLGVGLELGLGSGSRVGFRVGVRGRAGVGHLAAVVHGGVVVLGR